MSRQLTTSQLWESIRTSGLASAEECRRWAKGVTDSLGKSVAADPEQLIAALVKFGYLTPYQGNVLIDDPTRPLVLEGIRIEKSLEDQLGDHWYEGRQMRPDSNSRNTGPAEKLWVTALAMEIMAAPTVQSWPPSVTWAEHHTRVDAPQLDCWRNTGATLQHLFATVEPWTASSLATVLESGPIHTEQALRMIQDVASGLHTLHQAGLVHGQLSLESILVESNGTCRLRRDPFFPPRSPYHGTIPSLIPHPHTLLALAAPELALPDALPSIRSDLYALGCIWYRSVAGRWPIEPDVGSSSVTWASLHARIRIDIPKNFSELEGKCLLHLLAKEPSARFSSAKAFLNALRSNSKRSVSSDSPPSSNPASVAPVVREPAAAYDTNLNPQGEEKPTIDDATVGKFVSEIREKKVVIAPRNPHRSPKPKAPIVGPIASGPIDSGPTPTSVHPSVNSEAPSEKSSTVEPHGAFGSDSATHTSAGVAQGSTLQSGSTPSEPHPSTSARSTSVPSAPASRNTPQTTAKRGLRKQPTVNNKKGTSKTKSKAKNRRPFWVMPALVAGSCLMLLGLVMVLRSRSPGVVTIANAPNKSKSSTTAKSRELTKEADSTIPATSDPLAERFEIRADDGNVPWAPPTAGPACSTDLLPMGIEALVCLSSRAWQHQGPVAPLMAWWTSLATEPPAAWWPVISVPPDAMEQVTVAWYPGNQPSTSRFVVRFGFKQPRKLSEIINEENWSSAPIAGGGETALGSIWIQKEDGNFDAMVCDGLSASTETTTKHVTFGPADLLKTIPATKETPFVMRRQLDLLRQASDASADLTLLVAPSFLYGDGKTILGPDSPRLLELLSRIVDDKIQAFLFRAQWDKDWYIEWRSLGNDLQAASRNSALVKSSIEAASDLLETTLVNQPAEPYWRAIANRFPQMLRSLAKWMRTGAEEGQVVVNAYLPQEALSNLLIGSWMAAQRDWNAVAATPANVKASIPSKSIEQWLDTPITVRIEQDSLENFLQAIATELKEASSASNDPLPMAINGAAFQKDGITRNQQVRNFEYTNTPVRQVLTALARRANPVTTVQSPNEKDQKVVWVVIDDPTTSSKKRLELTTRAWSESNNATLPSEFVLPNN